MMSGGSRHRLNPPTSPDVIVVNCAGPQLDLPQNVTVQQLETLLNGLLSNEEKLPYSFFVDNVELADELGQHLLKHKARTVSVLDLRNIEMLMKLVRVLAVPHADC